MAFKASNPFRAASKSGEISRFREFAWMMRSEGIMKKTPGRAIERLEARLGKLSADKKAEENVIRYLGYDARQLGQTSYGSTNGKEVIPVYIYDKKTGEVETRHLYKNELDRLVAAASKAAMETNAKIGWLCERLSKHYGALANPEKRLHFAEESAEHYEKGGQALRAAGMYSHALSLFEAQNYTWPFQGEMVVHLPYARRVAECAAALYGKIGKHTESAQMLEKAAEIAKKEERFKTLDISCLMDAAGKEYNLAGMAEKGRALISEAKRLREGPSGLIELARNNILGGPENYLEAAGYLLSALEKASGNSGVKEEVSSLLGLMDWQGTEQTAQAIAWLKTSRN